MDSPDPIGTRAFLVIFRVLSFGILILGSIASVIGAMMIVSATLWPADHVPGSGIGPGLVFLLCGLLFAAAGARGARIRTRRDFDEEGKAPHFASIRERLERWINL